MNKLQKADEEYYITCGYLLKLASKAGELFESSEPDEKREILKLLLQNCTLNGSSVCYDLKKPFDTLFDLGTRQIWLEERNCNITDELSRIADLFSDFKFVAQIKEEMEKVNSCLVLETCTKSPKVVNDC